MSRSNASFTWTLQSDRGTIKGYADKTSAADGDLVGLYVSTPAPTFDIQIFRLGWYDAGASAARLIQVFSGLPGHVQPEPAGDPATGLISAANWRQSTSLAVAGWPTGLYLLKLVASDGDQNYIPLVIRDDRNQHDFLFQHSATTDQAYNNWGGKSLYDFNSTGGLTPRGTTAAAKVSFDRPYEGNGSGTGVLNWELNMARWLESEGMDVAYASDLDVHRDATFADRVHAVLQAGHSEYWSKEMRDHLEAVRDAGKGLGFFTGDTGSRAVRFESSSIGPDRVMVFYGDASLDPLAGSDPPHATTEWYAPPLNRPVHDLIGIGTNAGVRRSADWIADGVEKAPDLFAETGFRNGDVVPNLVGYEYDGLWTPGSRAQPPDGLTVLGRAKVSPRVPNQADLDFSVRHPVPLAERQPAGRFSTAVRGSGVWAIYVQCTTASGTWYLEYLPGAGVVGHYRLGDSSYAILHLGDDTTGTDWQDLARDLRADYELAFGPAPGDLKVSAVVIRGAAAVAPLVFSSPDASPSALGFDGAAVPEDAGWSIDSGSGQLTLEPVGRGGETTLVLKPAARPERPIDESDSVVIRTPAGGPVVAVGTMQWSWALDSYGSHVDGSGNETRVDARVQILTRNLLSALRERK